MKPRIYLLIFVVLHGICHGQNLIEINDTNWELKPGHIVEFDGKTCLVGKAILKNTRFTNGIVEYDLWTNGTRSYPSISFRDQMNGDFETFYPRIHRMGLYDDALQYTPAYGGMSCWQLYHGEGYTVSYPERRNTWIHVKAVINQRKAQFYLDHAETPTLTANLVRPTMPGSLTFSTWNDRTYIANVTLTVHPEKQVAEIADSSIGTDWQISRLLEAKAFDSKTYPNFYTIHYAGWEDVTSDAQGLVNISRYRTIEKGVKNCVYARKLIYSEEDQTITIKFGYSDSVKLFLNEKLIYSGSYGYRSRGDSFTGTIGAYDSYTLDLKKGLNEIFLILNESFGGWGFILQSDTPLQGPPVVEGATKPLWNTPKTDLIPESAVYDPNENVVYVSNFDNQFGKRKEPGSYITKVSLDGDVLAEKWVEGLTATTGITIHDGKLYIVERSGIAEISIADAKITNRYPFPVSGTFPNDIAADDEGNLYITDSAGDPDLYVLKDGEISVWIASDQLSGTNGICVDGDSLIVGDCNHNLLQRLDIKTKSITPIVSTGSGVIDGVKKDQKGNILISLWRGELYRIDASGQLEQLLNTHGKFNIADFEYVPEKNAVIVPAFINQNVEAIEIE